jgi:hypothetical protein
MASMTGSPVRSVSVWARNRYPKDERRSRFTPQIADVALADMALADMALADMTLADMAGAGDRPIRAALPELCEGPRQNEGCPNHQRVGMLGAVTLRAEPRPSDCDWYIG